METIEIKDGEINVEDIMRQIRANIQKRRTGAGYVDIGNLISEPSGTDSKTNRAGNLKQTLDYINENWDINSDYNSNYIISHRPLIGGLLVQGRRLVHEEVRRYVDVVFDKQTEFNMRVVGILNELCKNIKCYSEAGAFSKETIELGFLEMLNNCKNVLNIGTRGDFLLMLKENGITAKGINPGDDWIKEWGKKGIDVHQAYPVPYLMSLSNDSLDGIFINNTIEYLQAKELIELVRLSFEKLKQESYFIAEIVNSGKVHPEVMKFLMELAGFRDIQLKFLSQSPEPAENSLYYHQDYVVIAKK